MTFNPCLLIPAYNHIRGLEKVLSKIKDRRIPILVVNDGSTDGTDQFLRQEIEKDYHLEVLTHEQNLGKGASMMTGLRYSAAQGFTHAVTIDADDQHNIEDLATFLDLAQTNPDSLILGEPVFDTDAPLERTLGHKFCWFWVCLASLTFKIGDALCGYRVYPLAPMSKILNKNINADRMDFDVKILIVMIRAGINFINLPTHVVYPADGISHFRYFRDNIDIVAIHVYMILGLPQFLFKKLTGKERYEQLGRDT